MNVLVVGAGAVGQVLAAHLKRGGARISLLVKDKHAEEARRGFNLRALHNRTSDTFLPDQVLTSTSEAVAQKWDLILLCMSSTALKRGTWLEELAKADGTFVCIQPGLEDPEFVTARVGRERLVWGMFPLIAFAEGDHMAFWLPPLGKLLTEEVSDIGWHRELRGLRTAVVAHDGARAVRAHEPIDDGALALVAEPQPDDDEGPVLHARVLPHAPQKRAPSRIGAPHPAHGVVDVRGASSSAAGPPPAADGALPVAPPVAPAAGTATAPTTGAGATRDEATRATASSAPA